MCHIIGVEPQFENIISNGPYIPMAASQRKPKTQWTPEERKDANLDQQIKSLIMSVLPDDQMNSDFQDSPDDKEDTRSNQEYMNDLEEEYQVRALLAKSKRFFKKGTQRFSSAKATDQTECHKCGKKGHFARDCWSKTSVPSYQSPFQPKLFHSSEHKPKLRHTKDFEAKYKKIKAKLALLSSSALAPSSSSSKNKGLIAETYDWDEEEVSSDDNEVTKVKALRALADEEIVSVGKESVRNGEWIMISMKKVHTLLEMEDNDDRKSFLDYISGPKDSVFIKSLANNSEVSITGSNKPKLSEAEDSTLSNHDTGKHHLPPLEKLTGVESVSRPKTIKSILKSKSTFKAETLKGIIINEPSSAPARDNKSSSASKTNSAPTGKLKNVKIEDDPPLAIVIKELNDLKLQISKNKSSYFINKNSQQCKRTNHRTCDHAEFMSSININQYHTCQGESSSRSRPSRPAIPFPSCIHCGYNDHISDDCVYYPIFEICGSYDHDTHGHNRIISLRRGIKPRNPQHVTKNCETCGSNVHTTSDHNDIEWFRKREALQAKKVESFKASKTESSSALRSKTPTKRYLKGTPSLGLHANKQQSIAMFSTEDEDIAAAGCCANILWIKSQLTDYDIIYEKISFSIPTGDIYGKVRVNTFRNAIGAHYLPHSREYVAPPSINIVRLWFETIGYEETIPVKVTLKKSLFPPSWRLLMAHIIHCLGEDIIIKLNKRHREKVVAYTRFLSLLMMHKMKEGYGDGEVTPYPTQVFSVNNWALKPNQPEEPLFTDHMLAICNAAELVAFKAPKPSSNAERVPQGTKPGAKPGHKKHSTSSKQPICVQQRGNKSQTSASIPVVAEMHKENQQATGGPTSLGVTSEAKANPQLSSGISAFNLNKPIYSTSFIIHSESASGDDASVVSTTEADPGKSAPSDFVPQQQGMNEGTKTLYLFACTDPHVLVDKTQSVREGLETVLTQPTTGKGTNSIARQVEEDEALRIIKLKDLAKLVSSVQPSFKDLDSPEDDPIIVVDGSDEDEEANEVYVTTNVETEDTSIPKSSSPAFGKVLLTEFSNILSAHDFSSSLPTELKDPSSKFNELTEEVKGLKKQVHELEIELPGDLKEIPSKLEDFTKTLKMVQATKLKRLLDALPSLPTKPQMLNILPLGHCIKGITGELQCSKEQINSTKEIEERAKAKAKQLNMKSEEEKTKEKLVDLLGIKNHQNCDVLTKKGPITLKVYREDGTSEVIPNFKANDLHLSEWREVMNACPNRTGKKGLAISSGLGLDDHVRTFSSLLLAEVDKRNLNTLKQMRVIEQLRQ
ncbi:retrovirus-related pol polyprotein from transposon TNT 1-94 [Tanacetum coccineum]